MYEPNYSLTHKFINNLITLETFKTKIEAAELSTQVLHTFNKSTKAKDLMHFAHIMGVSLTLKDSEKAIKGKNIYTDDIRGTILNNFRNVYEYMRSTLSTSYIDLDINTLHWTIGSHFAIKLFHQLEYKTNFCPYLIGTKSKKTKFQTY